MPAVGLHRLSANDSLPMLPSLRRYSEQVRVTEGRAQRVPNGHRLALELERLLLSKRQQVAGGRLWNRTSTNSCGYFSENCKIQ